MQAVAILNGFSLRALWIIAGVSAVQRYPQGKLLLVHNHVRSDSSAIVASAPNHVALGETLQMTELTRELEGFEILAAECDLIARLTTVSRTREQYLQLAGQYRELAANTRRSMTSRSAPQDVMM